TPVWILCSNALSSASTHAIHRLSLHDALPIFELGHLGHRRVGDDAVAQPLELDQSGLEVVDALRRFGDARLLEQFGVRDQADRPDRKSTRLNSSHVKISYAVFRLKKKTN